MKKRRLKKWISYVLAASVLAGACGTIAVSGTEDAIEQGETNALAVLDFENGNESPWGFSHMTGIYRTGVVDEAHGTSLFLDNKETAGTRAYIDLETPVDSGVYYITYEVMNTTATAYNYSAFHVVPREEVKIADDYMKTFTFQKAGKFGHFYGLDVAWTIDQNTVTEYEANRWYKMEQWIDFNRRTIDFYVDNEFFATQSLPDHFNVMHGMYLVQDIEKWASTAFR